MKLTWTIGKIFAKGIQFLYSQTYPQVKNEELRRRGFILNIILFGSLVLILSAISIIIIHSILLGDKYHGRGIPLSASFVIFFVFAFLYGISRRGFIKVASYILITIYFCAITYTTLNWGANVPEALLAYSLSIIMSGILISSRFATIFTLIIALSIYIIGYLQVNQIITPNLYWKEEPLELSDVVVYMLTFLGIAVVSWLSNREIDKSLFRALYSEKELKKERDLLEVKIKIRTEEIYKAQYERIRQLYHFAEFGRLSSGLFHDLTNYLTVLSFNLENAKKVGEKEIADAKVHLEQALTANSKIEGFIEMVQKQLKQQSVSAIFSLNQEIEQSIQLLNYKAMKNRVEIIFDNQESIDVFGNCYKFNQIMTNLISNAIDAYDDFDENNKREVIVKLARDNDAAVVRIEDWGCGILPNSLGNIFDPFFTTKNHYKGTGLGLSTSKDIIEKEFKGQIEVKSEKNKGTIFIIRIPFPVN